MRKQFLATHYSKQKKVSKFLVKKKDVLKSISGLLSVYTARIKELFYVLSLSVEKSSISPKRLYWENRCLRQFVKISLAEVS